MKYALASAIALATTAIAAVPTLAQVPRPVLMDDPNYTSSCYLVDSQGRVYDLRGLCGYEGSPWAVSTPRSTDRPTYSEADESSRTPTGRCDVPDDIAADGSRCGGRAASERPGGQ